jgi:nicotinamidase-related amidase
MRIPIDTVLLSVGPRQTSAAARNNPDAEDWIEALLAVWRQCGMPVLHVRVGRPGHGPAAPGGPGPAGDEPQITSQTGDAFLGTGLDERLTSGGHTTLVICGAPTDGAISSTARHAAGLGFRVFVAADACWAEQLRDPFGETWPAETVHGVALAGLHGAHASIVEARTACEAAALIASRRK